MDDKTGEAGESDCGTDEEVDSEKDIHKFWRTDKHNWKIDELSFKKFFFVMKNKVFRYVV